MLELEHVTPILNVSSVPESMAWFESLGWTRSFAWNQSGMIENAADRDEDGEADYAGIISGRVELFLCLDAQGSRCKRPINETAPDSPGVWMTWWLATPQEVEDLYGRVQALGLPVVMPLMTQPWNAVEFRIRHPDGHTFRVSAFME